MKCKVCKGTKISRYRGREFACGKCSDDPLQVAFRKALAKPPSKRVKKVIDELLAKHKLPKGK